MWSQLPPLFNQIYSFFKSSQFIIFTDNNSHLERARTLTLWTFSSVPRYALCITHIFLEPLNLLYRLEMHVFDVAWWSWVAYILTTLQNCSDVYCTWYSFCQMPLLFWTSNKVPQRVIKQGLGLENVFSKEGDSQFPKLVFPWFRCILERKPRVSCSLEVSSVLRWLGMFSLSVIESGGVIS